MKSPESLNAITLLKELRDTTPITAQRKLIDNFLTTMGDAAIREEVGRARQTEAASTRPITASPTNQTLIHKLQDECALQMGGQNHFGASIIKRAFDRAIYITQKYNARVDQREMLGDIDKELIAKNWFQSQLASTQKDVLAWPQWLKDHLQDDAPKRESGNLQTKLDSVYHLLNHIHREVSSLEDFDAASLMTEIEETLNGTRIFNDNKHLHDSLKKIIDAAKDVFIASNQDSGSVFKNELKKLKSVINSIEGQKP